MEEWYGKADAGTREWFERVDGTRYPFEKALQNILWAGKQSPIVLQSMFHRFGEESRARATTVGNTHSRCLEQGAQIKLVQVYSTARKPRTQVLPLKKKS